jgi:hypothetical protein
MSDENKRLFSGAKAHFAGSGGGAEVMALSSEPRKEGMSISM